MWCQAHLFVNFFSIPIPQYFFLSKSFAIQYSITQSKVALYHEYCHTSGIMYVTTSQSYVHCVVNALNC